MDVSDRDGKAFKLTHARWQRYIRHLKQYEGWASSLSAEYGHETIAFLEASHLVDSGATDDKAVIDLVKQDDPEGEPYETELMDQNDEELVIKVVERRTGFATTRHLRRDMFSSQEYRSFVRVHGELKDMAGTPPFTVAFGKKEPKEQPEKFEDLRRAVLEVAGEGVPLSRFKGLGEMNPDQLFTTTMDPSQRTLQRVTIEDASAADLVFSMLMGDKVEPRREFIEAHARDVTNLDV
jgi:DNA gyrase subunit B